MVFVCGFVVDPEGMLLTVCGKAYKLLEHLFFFIY